VIDRREAWAWLVFYLIASILALMVAIFILHFFLPSYEARSQASGPVEDQFYRLLVDKGYWMTGIPRDAEFSEGMTDEGRARFFRLLSEIRFREDCLEEAGSQVRSEIACVVNGKEITVVHRD